MSRKASLLFVAVIVPSVCTAYDPLFFTGNGAGHPPLVAVHDRTGPVSSMTVWDSSFTGGVPVAMGDVNGDGVPDLVCGQGPGGTSGVKVLNGSNGSTLFQTTAFPTSHGSFVAVGDVNGDGLADIVTGAGSGIQNRVRVFDGGTGSVLRDFVPFDESFTGGVFVAAGDVNFDGRADIVTGTGAGTVASVKVFNGSDNSLIREFHPFIGMETFTGGARVACGDYDGDGRQDIFTSTGAGIPSEVYVWNGWTGWNMLAWSAFGDGYSSGIHIASADVTQDELSDVIVHATGAIVRVMSAHSLSDVSDVFVRPFDYAGHLFVAAGESKVRVRTSLNLPHRAVSAPPLTVELRQLDRSNNNLFPPLAFLENRSGEDGFATPFAGMTANFYLKASNTIGARVSDVSVVAGLSLGTVTLFGGDVTGDDSINIQDFLALRQSFGTSSGQPGFNPNADLDGNGSVGIGDFVVLRTNFGRSGPGIGG